MQEIFVDGSKQSLRGNMHTHTIVSDGEYSCLEVLKIYEEGGYDFLGVTDHEVFCNFSNNLSSIILILGIEEAAFYTSDDDLKGTYTHFNCFKPKQDKIVGKGYYKNVKELQSYLDNLKENYALIQLNHPLFSRLREEDLLSLHGYDLVEIYNHKDFMMETGFYCADYLIRLLLNNHKKFWISANDDFHGPYFKTKNDMAFGGFIMVQSAASETSILEAIAKGCFYPSTGPLIKDFRREDDVFKIITSPVKRIIFYSNLRRCKNIYDLNNADITEGEYTLKGGEYYLWVNIIDKDGKMAWSQPVYLD